MANKVYRAVETAITFKDTDATYTITLNNLAATTGGRISDVVDRGSGSLPRLYHWRAVMCFETAPVVGEYVEIVLSESNGTYEDGNVGTTDAALTAAVAANLKTIGIVRVQTTDVDTPNIASGMCVINERYFSIGVLNKTADNLQADNDTSLVIMTPMPDEIQ